jgi:hypothetical protein
MALRVRGSSSDSNTTFVAVIVSTKGMRKGMGARLKTRRESGYSRRSAVMGLTESALRAGTRHAIAATASSRNETPSAISG